jgi:hypothetical protein
MLVLLVGSVAVPGVMAQSEMAYPVYDVTITEEGLELPEGIAPGIAAFKFDNSAREESESGVILFQLAEGVSMEEFFAGLQEAMMSEDAEALAEVGAILGGSWIEPGSTAELIYNLEPGQYVLLEFVREQPAIAPFEISSDMEPVADSVEADVTVEMVDYAFGIPDEIDGGEQIWELTNSGEEEHEVAVIQILDDSLTEDDIMEALNSGEEPEEGQTQQVASFISLQPGGMAWMSLDLEPGRYLLICFIEAPDGETHFHKGMLRLLNVN